MISLDANTLDDSVLNADEVGLDDVQPIENMNEEQIDALLEVEEVPTRNDHDEDPSNDVVPMEEEGTAETGNSAESTHRPSVHLENSESPVIEEPIILEEEDGDDEIMVIPNENSAPESSRKRLSEPINSPLIRKKRRPFRPYKTHMIAARRMISGIMASIDLDREMGATECIKATAAASHYRHALIESRANLQKYRKELDQRTEELRLEKIAHAGTWKKLENTINLLNELRAELTQANNLAHIRVKEPAVAKPRTELIPQHERMDFVPMVPNYLPNQQPPTYPPHQTLANKTAQRNGMPLVLIPKIKPVTVERPVYQPQRVGASTRITPVVPVQPSEQYHQQHVANISSVFSTTWINSVGRQYGHMKVSELSEPGPGPGKSLIDDSKKPELISLYVPLVDPREMKKIGSDHDCTIPDYFATCTTNPKIAVSIKSRSSDFVENWSICGRVNCEKLENSENSEFQIFVQFTSLSGFGMVGRMEDGELIQWGCSKVWRSEKKAYQFRIVLHKEQMVPRGDTVHVFACAKSLLTKKMEISSVASLFLTN